MSHPTATDGVWRVMRFEAPGGQWAEVASNHVGPEGINLPAGFRFVRSTPMVPAERLHAAHAEIDRLRALIVELAERSSMGRGVAVYAAQELGKGVRRP